MASADRFSASAKALEAGGDVEPREGEVGTGNRSDSMARTWLARRKAAALTILHELRGEFVTMDPQSAGFCPLTQRSVSE